MLITAIVSLRLCPGTPSNVWLLLEPVETRLTVVGGGLIPSLNAEAFVMRGATVGAAVEATAMDVERL